MEKEVRRKIELIEEAKNLNTEKCVFCGSPNVTNEHIFPVWMHRHLGNRSKGKATGKKTISYGDDTESATFKLAGDMRDWQVKSVCGGDNTCCNNGWMHDLENDVKPVLTPLILGDEIRLSQEKQESLAVWSIMKTMVVQHRITHHKQRKFLMDRKKPPGGWGVWIGNHTHRKFVVGYFPSTFSVLSDENATRRKRLTGAPNSLAVTFILKHLFVHVVYCRLHSLVNWWSFSDQRSNPLAGHLVKIWPPTRHGIIWPRKSLTDNDAEMVATSLWNTANRLGRERMSKSDKPL